MQLIKIEIFNGNFSDDITYTDSQKIILTATAYTV